MKTTILRLIAGLQGSGFLHCKFDASALCEDRFGTTAKAGFINWQSISCSIRSFATSGQVLKG
jgi:hypothetical protein